MEFRWNEKCLLGCVGDFSLFHLSWWMLTGSFVFHPLNAFLVCLFRYYRLCWQSKIWICYVVGMTWQEYCFFGFCLISFWLASVMRSSVYWLWPTTFDNDVHSTHIYTKTMEKSWLCGQFNGIFLMVVFICLFFVECLVCLSSVVFC